MFVSLFADDAVLSDADVFSKLPYEILVHILRFLRPRYYSRFGAVCRRFFVAM